MAENLAVDETSNNASCLKINDIKSRSIRVGLWDNLYALFEIFFLEIKRKNKTVYLPIQTYPSTLNCPLPDASLPIGLASSSKHHAFLSLFTLHTLHPAFEDGTDRRFRNVGKPQSEAGEIPNRTYTRR
jgi:hypothetical protein